MALRKKKLGLHFRRQHPIGPYVLDFYCDAARLAVEVDGEGHVGRVEADVRRDRWLLAHGVRTLRIRAASVRDDVDGVVEWIRAVASGEDAA